MVSPEEAGNKPEWWTDERYAIYDLSTNSAIAFPAHDEKLYLVAAPKTYKIRGYAYGGGGRRGGDDLTSDLFWDLARRAVRQCATNLDLAKR